MTYYVLKPDEVEKKKKKKRAIEQFKPLTKAKTNKLSRW